MSADPRSLLTNAPASPAALWKENAAHASGRPPGDAADRTHPDTGVVHPSIAAEVPKPADTRAFVFEAIDWSDDAAIVALAKEGQKLIHTDPATKAAQSLLKTPEGRIGFCLGTYLMAHAATVEDIENVRAQLEGEELRGYDLALSQHVGQVVTPLAELDKDHAPPLEIAGYAILRGMSGMTNDQKKGMSETLAENPVAVRGALRASKARALAQLPWWKRWSTYFGGAE